MIYIGIQLMHLDGKPYWKTKAIENMDRDEWEALCDGCGKCCLEKLKDEATGEVFYTYVSCRFLDTVSCRCKVYESRFEKAPDCIVITPGNIKDLTWLPDTCAYRIIYDAAELERWHPLVSGDPETVHQAGISVRDKVVPGDYVHPDDLEGYII